MTNFIRHFRYPIFLVCFHLAFSPSSLALAGSKWIEAPGSGTKVRLLAFMNVDRKWINAALHFELKSGWHLYWKNPRSTGLRPELKVTTNPQFSFEGPLFPIPEIIQNPRQPSYFSYGYQNQIAFPLRIPVSHPSRIEFKIVADYLICSIQCIPEKLEWTESIDFAKQGTPSVDQPIFDKFMAQIPHEVNSENWISSIQVQSNSWALEFKEPMKEIFISRDSQSNTRKPLKVDIQRLSPRKFQIDMNEPIEKIEWTGIAEKDSQAYSGKVDALGKAEPAIWLILIFALLGGFILNLMPCVLPVVLLKTAHLLSFRENRVHLRTSLAATTAGIMVSFLALALMTIILRQIGHQIGWGFQFQNPSFILFLIFMIFLFALNFFDIFSIGLGTSATTRLSSVQGSFGEGVLATLLATPCSAPFLGTALTFALSKSIPILILVFLFMGIGLSAPYLAVMAHPKLITILPRPGPWMDRLKRLLAYSLLLTIIWLLYILQQIISSSSLILVLLSLVAIFVLVREWRHKARWLFIGLLVIFALARIPDSISKEVEHSNIRQVKAELSEGKKLFIIVTADWCLTCKFNEQTVTNTDWFLELLRSKNYEKRVLDWTKRDDEVGDFLKSHQRVAIPFSAIALEQKVIVLPELLTRSIVESAFKDLQP